MTADSREKLLADVDAYCDELRPIEELCYVEHRYNEQTVELAKKYNLLGMPVPVEFGGRGADAVTYARALVRIGREGTGVRTFFSGQTSIGQYPIMRFGNAEQHARYLPASCRGEKLLAFALTEPDAGSNPLEMTSTYRRAGERYLLNGVKYLISNGGIADVAINKVKFGVCQKTLLLVGVRGIMRHIDLDVQPCPGAINGGGAGRVAR